jgi:hypothetical protein
MKIKVVKNAYYVSEDLSGLGMIDENEFQSSFSHLLVVGDVWEKDEDGDFVCIEGEWKGECNDGWWEYNDVKKYFKKVV